MGGRRGRDKNTLDGFVGEDVVKRGGDLHIRKLPFYQSGFPFRRDADIFQWHAEIVKYRVKIGERVLAHADEGIRILVRLGEEALGAEAFVAVYQ
jgi:hypothetical protein